MIVAIKLKALWCLRIAIIRVEAATLTQDCVDYGIR
jgi:hypothetical protein